MAQKKKTTKTKLDAESAPAPAAPAAPTPRPRLRKLTIRNLGCIGPDGVVVELDNIVVLVGPNNAGKSTILYAYDLAMKQGSREDKLPLSFFPDGKVDPTRLPQIELETVVHGEDRPANKWVWMDGSDAVVRERWTWSKADASPERDGYNFEKDDWDTEAVPWGAAGVAKARRPVPHRITSFDSPEEQAGQVAEMLLKAVKERIKSKKKEGDENTDFAKLLGELAKFQRAVLEESVNEIQAAEQKLTKFMGEVFPGYKVTFDARPEEDLSEAFNFFKAGAQLRVGYEEDHLAPMERQGSGAQRALMWAALRFIASNAEGGNDSRPHLLLLDEPELCLHPNAVRQACKVLYDLASIHNWQVMVTTHSPAFLDLSRDNTTIVRVAKSATSVTGTTVFRSARQKLDDDARRELKLLNLCDPTVNEFFFGGQTIIVEGDTEYAAFKNVIAESSTPEKYSDVNIIRARGKAVIILLSRILNQFATSYSVLHDTDDPLTKVKGKLQANGAWKLNADIRSEAMNAKGKVRHLALMPNFEAALFGAEARNEKPYNAIVRMRSDPGALAKVEELLSALVDHGTPKPAFAVEFDDLEVLKKLWEGLNSVAHAAVPPLDAEIQPESAP